MKTILITGINGYLGSNLAKALSKEYTIIGLEYSLDNLYRIKDCNFKIYSSQQNLKQIFIENTINTIVHTATVYRKNNEPIDNLISCNIHLPVKLLELSEAFGVSTFINTDSFFNDPNSSYSYLGEYTLSKRHCIEWLKSIQKDTQLINMKLFHMYGPYDSPFKFVNQMINAIKANQKEINLTPGEQKRDFTFIRDVVDAYKSIIKNIHKLKKYSEIEVGTGKATTIKEFVNTIKQLTQSNSKLNFGALDYRKGEIMCSQANNTQLKSLGWQPKWEIVKGLSESIR